MLLWVCLSLSAAGLIAALILRKSPKSSYDAKAKIEMNRRMIGDKTPSF